MIYAHVKCLKIFWMKVRRKPRKYWKRFWFFTESIAKQNREIYTVMFSLLKIQLSIVSAVAGQEKYWQDGAAQSYYVIWHILIFSLDRLESHCNSSVRPQLTWVKSCCIRSHYLIQHVVQIKNLKRKSSNVNCNCSRSDPRWWLLGLFTRWQVQRLHV